MNFKNVIFRILIGFTLLNPMSYQAISFESFKKTTIENASKAKTKLKRAATWINNNKLISSVASMIIIYVVYSSFKSKVNSQSMNTIYASDSSSNSVTTGRSIKSDSWLEVPETILFYNKNQPYYEFTNFYEHPVHIDGKNWPTTEHYFQAMKFSDIKEQEHIRTLRTPREVFDYARKAKIPTDWHRTTKFQVMLKSLRAKFQDFGLKRLLLNTGEKILVENAGAKDAFWGAGADGKGENHLGRLLMLVRYEISKQIQLAYNPKTTLSFASLKQANFDVNKAL